MADQEEQPLLPRREAHQNTDYPVYFAFVVAAQGGTLFGFIVGVTSNVLTGGQLLCNAGVASDAGLFGWDVSACYRLTPAWIGLLTCQSLIGAIAASWYCFYYADVIGRRREMQLAACFYLIGAGMAGLGANLSGVILGFFIYGLGVGFAMHGAPTFIAEIAPSRIRGQLIAAKEAMIVAGMCFGFFAGYVFQDTYQGWRWMVLASSCFSLPFSIGLCLLPPSPRWLMLRACQYGESSRRDEALESLRYYRRGVPEEALLAELLEIEAVFVSTSNMREISLGDLLTTYRRQLIIGCGCVFFQQVTGQPSVLFYSTNIFKSAGFQSSAASVSVIVGVAKLVATLVASLTVDRFGRKPLLHAGIGLMLMALIVMGCAFLHRSCALSQVRVLDDCEPDQVVLAGRWGSISVAATMLYVVGYQLGFGPISWLIVSEVFPLRARSSALSTAAFVNFGTNIVVALSFTSIQHALGQSSVFFVYAALCVVSLAFVSFFVPETKGKTLEEIEAFLAVAPAVGEKGFQDPTCAKASSL